MRADSSDEVVNLLEESGHWQDESSWRCLGDMPNNYSSIGNQQSDPVASLVEKIINGVDARLMNACLEQGIEPESAEAPQSMREGVSRFFEGGSDARVDGMIRHWSEDKRRREGSLLTVTATGYKPQQGDPCITIADRGEGQTPDEFPNTFMSLQKGNKSKIQFVQGRYNMGGTGALNFCAGPHRLQLIISRRNPAILKSYRSERDNQWGFTVVRRETPKANEKNSTFTYLAPVYPSSDSGMVLSFISDTWPLFPKDGDAYSVDSNFGTLIKLYEYDLPNRSNIVSSEPGLFRRLDLGMPEIILPVGVFECRSAYKGTATGTINGIVTRLAEDRAHIVEPEFPEFSEISWENQRIPIRIYAFKQGQGKHYRTSDAGVIFTLNGQTHASLPRSFYKRKSVSMSYLADSLLVIADCSNLQRDRQEELFMTSRDRMRRSDFSKDLERNLETLLSDNSTLKDLRNRRRSEQINDELGDDKPLLEILNNLVKKDPTLAKLLKAGSKISAPFGPGPKPKGKSEFVGKRFPTYFHFKKRKYGEILERDAFVGKRVRLDFVTDAVNDYFGRDVESGQLTLKIDELTPVYSVSPLRKGSCSINLEVPKGYTEGDIFNIEVTVIDESNIEPFVNIARVKLKKGDKSLPGPKPKQPKFSDELSLPTINLVKQDEWEIHDFDEESGVSVKSFGQDKNNSQIQYDFFVNIDNIFLKTEQKNSKLDVKALEARFIYGLVLFSMAILRDPKEFMFSSQYDDTPDIEEIVKRVSRGLARIMLPVFNTIGNLAEVDFSEE